MRSVVFFSDHEVWNNVDFINVIETNSVVCDFPAFKNNYNKPIDSTSMTLSNIMNVNRITYGNERGMRVRIYAVEMRFLRRVCGFGLIDCIRNVVVRHEC